MKYQVSTNKGNLIIDASSEYDARRRAEHDGLSVYSVSSYYGSDPAHSNAGDFSVDLSGGFGVGIGGGMVIESDGDLGLQIAPGISIDTGLDLF